MKYMKYRETDGMYYIGDDVVDGDGWVDEKTFDLFCKENKIALSSKSIKLNTQTFNEFNKKLSKLFRI